MLMEPGFHLNTMSQRRRRSIQLVPGVAKPEAIVPESGVQFGVVPQAPFSRPEFIGFFALFFENGTRPMPLANGLHNRKKCRAVLSGFRVG